MSSSEVRWWDVKPAVVVQYRLRCQRQAVKDTPGRALVCRADNKQTALGAWFELVSLPVCLDEGRWTDGAVRRRGGGMACKKFDHEEWLSGSGVARAFGLVWRLSHKPPRRSEAWSFFVLRVQPLRVPDHPDPTSFEPDAASVQS